jgi:hypothetical protein
LGKILAGLIVLVAVISCTDNQTTKGYDVACQIFTKADASNQTLSYETLINELANVLGKGDQVVVAWEALINLTPDQRYDEFEFFAREYHAVDWSCPAMELLAPTL